MDLVDYPPSLFNYLVLFWSAWNAEKDEAIQNSLVGRIFSCRPLILAAIGRDMGRRPVAESTLRNDSGSIRPETRPKIRPVARYRATTRVRFNPTSSGRVGPKPPEPDPKFDVLRGVAKPIRLSDRRPRVWRQG